MYRSYHADFTLLYGISNDCEESVFVTYDGQKFAVKRPENKRGKPEGTIVICSADYEAIAEQMVLLGYIPLVDFIDYGLAEVLWSGRQIALFYGFCHLRGVVQCLRRTKTFSDAYTAFYEPNYLPLNFYRMRRLRYLAENCGILIYGMALTPENYRKNSAILGGLKCGVKKICLPAVYFGGYFPQGRRSYNAMNELAVKCEGYDFTPFSYGDSWLNDCIIQGVSLYGILEQIEKEEVYSRDFILNYEEREWKRLRYQERDSDIKVVDYLEKNYKVRRLFRNETHMENEIIYQYAERILQVLGCSGNAVVSGTPLLSCSQHFIYPCVAKALDLEWDVWKEELDLYTYNGWKKVSMVEYIKAYYESCGEILRLKRKYMLP